MVGIIGAGSSDAVSAREHENDQVAYRAALESIVLLRNNGALPLKEKRIALFGSGASHTIKGGTGSGEVNNRHSVSIYEGLLNRGVEVTSEKWIREYDALAEEEHAKWLKEHQGIPSVALLSPANFPSPNIYCLFVRHHNRNNAHNAQHRPTADDRTRAAPPQDSPW